MKPSTFTFEEIALRSLNYLERLADVDGLPYFNVFWTEPAEAAHDWPDFGDVTARQLQGIIMLREMTGTGSSMEEVWLRNLLSWIDPEDGLMYRPQTAFSDRTADWGDAALTLYALVTAYLSGGDSKLRERIRKMVSSLHARAVSGDVPEPVFRGFIMKSLMSVERRVTQGEALDLCRIIAHLAFEIDSSFTQDNRFTGHMHGNLRTLVGAVDYAHYTGDKKLLERVNALFQNVQSFTTRFGFLPELVWRPGDIVACETCALMDYAGLGVTLANLGHRHYWSDMERLARNHLAESQVNDMSWLQREDNLTDTRQFTWTDIPQRLRVAWAGWSSPNHILACRETLHWGGAELRGKTRAVQNCCGGSGVHGLFILWKNASAYSKGELSVNMHIDKLLPEAEIRCFQPWQGLLTVQLRSACTRVKIRMPDFADSAAIRVRVNDTPKDFSIRDGFAEIASPDMSDRIEMHYPLVERREKVSVGNPGFRQWKYGVTWKGDTVIDLQPVDNEIETAFSDFEHREVEVFYGIRGPGPLYQRDRFKKEARPSLSRIHLDNSGMNFWVFN
jgi:hypothetical protein